MSHEWEQRVKGLVYPHVKSVEEYERLTRSGLHRAEAFLKLTGPVPNAETIENVHALAFAKVYPFSGQFRKKGQQTGALGKEGKFETAYHTRIEPELRKLSEQAKELFKRAQTDQERAKAIAFYHVKFESIHPFLDGNGRTGRLILESQVRSILKKEPEQILDRESYIGALDIARESGNLTELTYFTTGIPLPREVSQTPFPIELEPITLRKPLLSGKEVTLRTRDVDTAEDFEFSRLTSGVDQELSNLNRPIIGDFEVRGEEIVEVYPIITLDERAFKVDMEFARRFESGQVSKEEIEQLNQLKPGEGLIIEEEQGLENNPSQKQDQGPTLDLTP